ncbi:MAG: hypothetical protein U0263_39690 [Polyangiaceae bacterium]
MTRQAKPPATTLAWPAAGVPGSPTFGERSGAALGRASPTDIHVENRWTNIRKGGSLLLGSADLGAGRRRLEQTEEPENRAATTWRRAVVGLVQPIGPFLVMKNTSTKEAAWALFWSTTAC